MGGVKREGLAEGRGWGRGVVLCVFDVGADG